MTLKEELIALRLKGESRRTPEVIEKMHRAVDELRRSGAADRILKVGDRAPEFALPNANEQVVDSKSLLAKGPLVLSFYRGRW
jgi:hypothetical protein